VVRKVDLHVSQWNVVASLRAFLDTINARDAHVLGRFEGGLIHSILSLITPPKPDATWGASGS
jgi:hypothetical protein